MTLGIILENLKSWSNQEILYLSHENWTTLITIMWVVVTECVSRFSKWVLYAFKACFFVQAKILLHIPYQPRLGLARGKVFWFKSWLAVYVLECFRSDPERKCGLNVHEICNDSEVLLESAQLNCFFIQFGTENIPNFLTVLTSLFMINSRWITL